MPDPIDNRKPPVSHFAGRTAARMLITAALMSAMRVSANCPAPLDPESQAPSFAPVDPDSAIAIESDSAEATRDGQMLLKGEVTITQGARTIKTRDATYDQNTGSFSVDNGVDFSDPTLRIRGAGADVDPIGGATFTGAEFELPAIPARGAADRISASPAGDVELEDVRYTTCPIGNEDWLLSASEIDISQQRGIGTGRNVRLDFKSVPILYVPYF